MSFQAPANLVQRIASQRCEAKTSFVLKAGLAQNFKVSMVSFLLMRARIAEEAGACAVMALERVPADIRKNGGLKRISNRSWRSWLPSPSPSWPRSVSVTFVEAQILQSIGVDYIDESEVLTPADDIHHIDKNEIGEGASMIRTKGEAGTGNVVEAVRHARTLMNDIRRVKSMAPDELYAYAKDIQAPIHLVQEVARLGRLPSSTLPLRFMMHLGMDGVFVGSGIFQRARAIVQAVTHYKDPKVIAEVSEDLGEAWLQYAKRGW
ncbi:SOR/SNZ family-domain-containing protein [Chytridium lagenaria]|nr:SOR/SNZ family-domain-containing protein [Chytridium lagenaria]